MSYDEFDDDGNYDGFYEEYGGDGGSDDGGDGSDDGGGGDYGDDSDGGGGEDEWDVWSVDDPTTYTGPESGYNRVHLDWKQKIIEENRKFGESGKKYMLTLDKIDMMDIPNHIMCSTKGDVLIPHLDEIVEAKLKTINPIALALSNYVVTSENIKDALVEVKKSIDKNILIKGNVDIYSVIRYMCIWKPDCISRYS